MYLFIQALPKSIGIYERMNIHTDHLQINRKLHQLLLQPWFQ